MWYPCHAGFKAVSVKCRIAGMVPEMQIIEAVVTISGYRRKVRWLGAGAHARLNKKKSQAINTFAATV